MNFFALTILFLTHLQYCIIFFVFLQFRERDLENKTMNIFVLTILGTTTTAKAGFQDLTLSLLKMIQNSILACPSALMVSLSCLIRDTNLD